MAASQRPVIKISLGAGGLPTVAFAVFLTLKLCHVIDWSWWWVTCPLWIGIAIVAAFFIVPVVAMLFVATVAGLSLLIIRAIDWIKWRRHRKDLTRRR